MHKDQVVRSKGKIVTKLADFCDQPPDKSFDVTAPIKADGHPVVEWEQCYTPANECQLYKDLYELRPEMF